MKTITGQFLDFARSKPPEEAYDYMDRYVCACAQFAETLGLGEQYADLVGLVGSSEQMKRTFIPIEIVAGKLPWTWGGLVERLEELEVSHP